MQLRIGFIGGESYIEADLEAFLLALHQKHPTAIIVTGLGRGAERVVKTQMEAWGHTVEIPPLHPEWFAHPLDCQVNDILIASDIIVTIGSPEGSRAKIARAIHRRIDMLYEPWAKSHRMRELGRPLHNVAAPPTKKQKPGRRPSKKQKELIAA